MQTTTLDIDTIPDIPHDLGEPGRKLERGPQHERMAPCIGEWRMKGALAESGAPMDCTETYEWVPGQFFVAYRFDRKIGSDRHNGRGLFGYDAERNAHFAYFVDNMGYARTYDVHINDGTWTFSGRWERATLLFDAERGYLKAHWEHSQDGRTWKTLCDFEGGRVS